MKATGCFPEGLIINGMVYKEFTLEEHTFRHTLELASDPAIDYKRLDDPAYYQAAVFSRRLSIPGVRLSVDDILEMSGIDGQELVRASNEVELQRKIFRDAAAAATEGHDSPAETGD